MVEWHLKVISCLLLSPKFEFVKFENTMFQMVARQRKLIFFLLNSLKCDLGEGEKAMFQEYLCHIELIYGLLTILNATRLRS